MVALSAKRYAGQANHLIAPQQFTHLNPSHFALVAAQAALSMASAHRHLGQGEQGDAGLARHSGKDLTYGRATLAHTKRYEGVVRSWFPLRGGPQTLSLACLYDRWGYTVKAEPAQSSSSESDIDCHAVSGRDYEGGWFGDSLPETLSGRLFLR